MKKSCENCDNHISNNPFKMFLLTICRHCDAGKYGGYEEWEPVEKKRRKK